MTDIKQLEDRYIVLKTSDCIYLPISSQESLAVVRSDLEVIRSIKRKEPLQAIVIEADWPEYEIVKDMLLKRINNIKV